MTDQRDPRATTTGAGRSGSSGRWVGTTVVILAIIALLGWWVGAYEGAEFESQIETPAADAPTTDAPATDAPATDAPAEPAQQ